MRAGYPWCHAHGFFDHRQKIAAAGKPRRTPSNGLETANQKERRQPDSSAVRFVFMLIPQAGQHRYFTKRQFLFVCFERSTLRKCSTMFVVESTATFVRYKRRESPHERLGTCPASTGKHYSPLAATSRSALMCPRRNCSVRSLVQSRLTPESMTKSRCR